MSMNAGITNVVRPQTLDEVVGNEANKRIIRYAIEGARLRNEPYPSFICSGPPSSGKTTLAQIIASLTGGKIHKIMGSDLTKIEDLYLLLADCSDHDCLFFEEAHLLSSGKHGKIIQNNLLLLIEDFDLPSASMYGLNKIPKVYCVFATTSPGKLSYPLRSRCKRLDAGYYAESELVLILLNAAKKLGFDFSVDMEAVEILAKSSRGMPRTAIMQRLDPLLNVMSVDGLAFNKATVIHFLKVMQINPLGLEPNDLKYCEILRDVSKATNGNPVATKTIQGMMGCATDLVSEVIEPYLLQSQLITISTKGRSLTAKGHQMLRDGDMVPDPPVIFEEPVPTETPVIDKFDPAYINQAIAKHGTDLGIVALMKIIGIRYHNVNERSLFYEALDKAGWKVKVGRSGGLIPKPLV